MQRNINGFLPDGSVTDVKLSTALRQSLQQKNFLKNPNFAVIQGTASGTIANSLALPTASLGYLGETEWWLAASGGTPAYAFSQLNENVTFTGAVGTTAIHLGQRIESRDANKLKGKTVTLSVEISNSLLTSVTWELFNPTTTDDVHGTVAVPSQTLIATGTFTVSPTLTRYSATIVLPVGVSRGLGIRLRVGTQTSGTWVISRLQLEEGAIATNFFCDDYLGELQKCKRYYFASNLFVANGSSNVTTHSFVSMFATPIRVGGGAGYFIFSLNNEGVAHGQTTQNVEAFTFSSHIP